MMTILGVRAWHFTLMVLAAEIAPILVLVLAMFVVGTVQGGQPSQATASAWGSWIGPTFGALFTGLFAYRLGRGSNRPAMFGLAFGLSVAMLDLGLRDPGCVVPMAVCGLGAEPAGRWRARRMDPPSDGSSPRRKRRTEAAAPRQLARGCMVVPS
jgi:hypothetical protein